MCKIHSVIFDFNGTLYWDTQYHNEAWDLFLDKHKIQLTTEEKRHKIHGKLNQDILKGIFQRDLNPEEIDSMIQEKEAIYRTICLQNPLILAPGASDFLDYLKSVRVSFTIATAAEKINIDFYFKTLSLNRWFSMDKIVYNDGSFRGKPSPEIFLLALQRLHSKSEESLIFEDSYAGIKAAENAAAGKIIIVNSHNTDYDEWSHQVIRDFNEVDRQLFQEGL